MSRRGGIAEKQILHFVQDDKHFVQDAKRFVQDAKRFVQDDKHFVQDHKPLVYAWDVVTRGLHSGHVLWPIFALEISCVSLSHCASVRRTCAGSAGSKARVQA